MAQPIEEKHRSLSININGNLSPWHEAGVSPLDSSVLAGDAVWELLPLRHRRIFRLQEHLNRLRRSALALGFPVIPSTTELTEQVRCTLEVNHLRDHAAVRITLSRGIRGDMGLEIGATPATPTLIMVPEVSRREFPDDGISIITSGIRRPPPDCLDAKIHHCNLIPSILARLEAKAAGADEALMLDHRGFVADTSSHHIFVVDHGIVFTSRTVACAEGIARAVLMEICSEQQIPFRETDLTLAEVYRAEEVFCASSLDEVVPVMLVDGRPIGEGPVGQLTRDLRQRYQTRARSQGILVV